MVKHGFSDLDYEVPALESGKVLHFCQDSVPLHTLSSSVIGPLIDQAIIFLHLLLPRSGSEPRLMAQDMMRIPTFLRLQGEQDMTGDLYRNVDMNDKFITRWKCQGHTNHGCDVGVIKACLFQHKGVINYQQSTVAVRLLSQRDARSFSSALQRTKHVFDVTVVLGWCATRNELEDLIRNLSRSTRMLYLDGVTPAMHPQGFFEDQTNLFLPLIHPRTIQLLMLLNYPRTSEQYIYLGMSRSTTHGLLLSSTPGLPKIDWSVLHDGLDLYMRGIELPRTNRDIVTSLQGLSNVLCRLNAMDIKGVDIFDRTNDTWQARLGVSNCIVYGLSRAVFPNRIFSPTSWPLGTVGCLLVHPQELYDVLQIRALMEHPTMEALEILVQESETSGNIVSDLYHRWNHPNQLRLTLIEKGQESEVRNIASFIIWNEQPERKSVVCRWWNVDYVSGRSWDATLLEAAVRRFPTVLKSLTLDISGLTDRGLYRIQSVLQRSNLEHLHIRCQIVFSNRRSNVAQILRSVQWSSTISLVLSGDKIDTWIRLWAESGNLFPSAPTSGPQLHFLAIIGPSEKQHPLSHSSALALHRLICFSPLLELCLENVQMQQASDWDLIVDTIDFSTLKVVYAYNTSDDFTDKLDSRAEQYNIQQSVTDLERKARLEKGTVQEDLVWTEKAAVDTPDRTKFRLSQLWPFSKKVQDVFPSPLSAASIQSQL